jgi:hypothetical protein
MINNNENDILEKLLNKGCFIFGGHVYKNQLRGESTEDIDIACDDISQIKKIMTECEIKNHILSLDTCGESLELSCPIEENKNIKLDITNMSTIKDLLTRNPNPLRLIQTKDGIKYVNKRGNIKNNVDKTNNMIRDVKKKKLLWEDVPKLENPKHKEYFSDWSRYAVVRPDYYF